MDFVSFSFHAFLSSMLCYDILLACYSLSVKSARPSSGITILTNVCSKLSLPPLPNNLPPPPPPRIDSSANKHDKWQGYWGGGGGGNYTTIAGEILFESMLLFSSTPPPHVSSPIHPQSIIFLPPPPVSSPWGPHTIDACVLKITNMSAHERLHYDCQILKHFPKVQPRSPKWPVLTLWV